jgi:alpha-1,3-rhamnosyl/mannosyltransferase
MIRIGLDVSKAQGSADGIGTYTLELLRALLPILSDEQVWLYDLLHPVDFEALGHTLGGWPRGIRPRPSGRPAEDDLDLFHSTCSATPTPLGSRLLFTCHDLTVLSHPECHTLENKVHSLTGLLQAHLADAHFLAISENTASELHHRLEIPTDRIDVIHLAAAPHFRRLDGEPSLRLREHFQVEGNFLLAVGTLEPRKNLNRLLDAYAALPQDLRRQWPLLLVGGEGWNHQDLLRKLEEKPELSTARRLGEVNQEDLLHLYNAAELFVYPSLAEGFGLPLLEAMACGAPVLTSAGGATAEVAGSAAKLVDPHDTKALREALEALLTKPATREGLRVRGFERANAFSWTTTAEQTLALYHRLVA